FLVRGRRDAFSMLENHWLATEDLALRLGLDAEVRHNLQQTFERWDGKGPGRQKGEEINTIAALVNLADVVEVFHRTDGVAAATAVAQERSGTQFNPALVDVFCREAPSVFAELDSVSGWGAVIAAEPTLEVTLSDREFDEALEAIADFVDLKSP